MTLIWCEQFIEINWLFQPGLEDKEREEGKRSWYCFNVKGGNSHWNGRLDLDEDLIYIKYIFLEINKLNLGFLCFFQTEINKIMEILK